MGQLGVPHKRYSDEVKLKIVHDALTSGLSRVGICRKYSLCNIGLLRTWIRIFAPEALINEVPMKDKDEQQQEIERLKKLLTQCELELKREKMRADFLD